MGHFECSSAQVSAKKQSIEIFDRRWSMKVVVLLSCVHHLCQSHRPEKSELWILFFVFDRKIYKL